MNRNVLGATTASLVLLAGCGGDTAEPGAAEPDPGTAEVAEQSGAATDEPEQAAAGGEPTVLEGSVGTSDNPEAFVITLVDASGEPVTELPAGQYVIEVDDPSVTHNFHLVGDSVDEATGVPEVVETTFEVTLEPGDYTYVCDPHPNMVGSFTVT